MTQYVDGNNKGFTAGAALAKHARVKLSSGQVVAAGVGLSDEPVEIGTVTRETFAAGDPVDVRLRNAAGTTKMIAAGAITAGAAVYGAASGKISTTSSGNVIGVALEAAAADGDIIEVERY